MIRTGFLVAAPLALAAGLALASPAAAQRWDGPNQMRAEIAQLDREVERIAHSDRYTNGELRRMRNAVVSLEDIYHRYARDGFTSREISGLNDRIGNLRQRIRVQARDGDRLR